MNVHWNLDSIFEKYDRETALDTLQSLAKITSRTIAFAGYFDSTPELAHGKEIISGIQAIFTVRSTFNSIGKIVKQVTKEDNKLELTETLKTAASTIGVATGLLSIFKFSLSCKEIMTYLSEISNSLGGSNVIGEALFSSLFLNHISSALGLLQSVISITVDSIYIYERSKKIDSATQKIGLWKQPLNDAHIQLKLSRITYIQSNLTNETDAIILKLCKINSKTKTAQKEYNDSKVAFKQASGPKRIYKWIRLKSKKRFLKEQIVKKINQTELLEQSIEKNIKSYNKLFAWKAIHAKLAHLTDDEKISISTFQDDKSAKWEKKQKSLKFEQIKAACGLCLKVIGFIMTIAALILSATGVGLVPVLITMASISLLLAVTSFGFTLFKRHTAPIYIAPVAPPLLA